MSTTYAAGSDVLTGGRWIKQRGGLHRWFTDEELARLAATPAPTPAPTPRTFHVTGTPCTDCGCLLRDADELCPNCVRPWMYAQEKAWSERRLVIYYSPTHRKDVAA